ncbi:hypothetical protein XHV734_0415 [Xanthomonas hortorum pv. vitians]|nr:hypothetical protein XHV734_0415 [Xanthomonas hortorum pv. vitians]
MQMSDAPPESNGYSEFPAEAPTIRTAQERAVILPELFSDPLDWSLPARLQINRLRTHGSSVSRS